MELQRVAQFLDVSQPLCWDHGLKPQNVGRERLRNSPLRKAIVQAPLLTALRRKLIPRRLAESLKSLWKVGVDPPPVPSGLDDRLHNLFDPDLARLGSWLGIKLDCDSFHATTSGEPVCWQDLELHASEISLPGK